MGAARCAICDQSGCVLFQYADLRDPRAVKSATTWCAPVLAQRIFPAAVVNFSDIPVRYGASHLTRHDRLKSYRAGSRRQSGAQNLTPPAIGREKRGWRLPALCAETCRRRDNAHTMTGSPEKSRQKRSFAPLFLITARGQICALRRGRGSLFKTRLAQKIGNALRLAGRVETRSEERRVGKECRSRWSPYH